MVQIFILLNNEDLEKMLELEDENKISLIQELEEYNMRLGILKCLDFKKNFDCVPVGFELLEIDDETFEVFENERFFFNGKIINKENCPNEISWKKMFKDFPYIKEYVYINENFCIPYDNEKDKIININI